MSKGWGLSGQDYLKSEAIKHGDQNLSDILDNNIVEVKSDTIGMGIKFGNGILINVGRVFIQNSSFNSQKGNMYMTNYTNPIVFTVPFKYNPTIVCSTADQNDYKFCFPEGIIRDSEKISRIEFLSATSGSGNIDLHFIAIGLWK